MFDMFVDIIKVFIL